MPSGYDVSMIVETEASSYELDLAAMRLRRVPKAEGETGHWAASRLRKDAEWIEFEFLAPLEIGKPAQFLLVIRNDGVRTIRTTTLVQAIRGMKLRQRIDENVRGILYVLLYPQSMRVAKVNLVAWFFALVFAVTSVGLFIADDNWTSPWLWFNAGLGAIDAYLLRRSWLGYRWRKNSE
jgi:hypothetical protein